MAVTISAQPQVALTQNVAPRNPAPASTPVAVDQVEVSSHKELDAHNFSWLDLGKGLAGAVVAATIDGIGMTAAAVPLAGKGIWASWKGLHNSNMIGKTLAATLYPVITLAGVAAVPLVAIGSVGYGLVTGFSKGAEDGPVAAGKQAVENTKLFYGDIGDKMVEGIQSASEIPLGEGQKPYDIRVGEGLRGLAAGTVTATMDGVAGLGLGVRYVPELTIRAGKELWKSDAALPLKVGGTVLLPAAIPLGVALGTVGGAVYGLGTGVKNGYTDGFTDAVASSAKDISKAQKTLSHLAKEM